MGGGVGTSMFGYMKLKYDNKGGNMCHYRLHMVCMYSEMLPCKIAISSSFTFSAAQWKTRGLWKRMIKKKKKWKKNKMKKIHAYTT